MLGHQRLFRGEFSLLLNNPCMFTDRLLEAKAEPWVPPWLALERFPVRGGSSCEKRLGD